jgi:hypothetical protein
MNKLEKPVPFSVTFFPNGMAAVCDTSGKQIGEYQGRHKFTVEALEKDGYDWMTLPDVWGSPQQ